MLDNPRGLSTEAELGRTRPEIEAVWAKRTQGQFAGVDGVSIAFAFIEPAERKQRAIIISTGRTEFIDKYSEVAFDLYQQGFAVYVIDHRGQGFSGRLLADAHKGHVAEFDHYVDDFHQLITEIVMPREALAPVLVGHSMGAAILARFLQAFPQAGAGAVLCSPMFEINTGAPQSVVWPILSRVDALLSSPGKEPSYIPYGVGYKATQFNEMGRMNRLTTSGARLAYFNQQYRDHPEVQMGSPTRHWLLQAFEATAQALAEVDRIEVPVAVVISDGDRIVRAGGAVEFVEALERLSAAPVPLLHVEGAEHELLMESDAFRLPTMNFILNFIETIDR